MAVYSDEKKEEIFNAIINKIVEGQSVRLSIKESPISIGTFFSWANDLKSPERLEQYARAMELSTHIMAEEILEIADDNSNDTEYIETKNGSVAVENKEWVNRSKLRVDARKWLMSKRLPKKYGDSIKVSGDAESPIETKLTIEHVQVPIPIKTEESPE